MKQQALQVLQTLEDHGFQARLAGGCVRDLLLHITPKDYDIATTATPEQVMKIFERSIPTGLDHGTVTVVLDSIPFEVTTLRRDAETDGRHATIEYSSTFEEDSLRRDFTINAMYQDRHGVVYDYHNGQQDIIDGRLMFVGNAEDRIKEDYLRILRFFRFLARLKFTTDLATIETVYELQSGLARISRERVNSELLQIFNYTASSKIIKWMQDAGVFSTVLGKFGRVNPPKELFESLDQLDYLKTSDRGLAKFALYLGSMSKESSDQFMKSSKLSLEQQNILEVLVVPSYAITILSSPPNVKHKLFNKIEVVAKKIGERALQEVVYPYWLTTLVSSDLARQQLANSKDRVHQVISMDKAGRRTHKIPITGNDLIARGTPKGQQLGETLKKLRNGYLDNLWTTKEEGFKYLESII